MDLYDVMHTTFAARDFVDEDVPDAVIRRILDHARFASSGGNRQGWKVIVVRNAATREALVPLMAGAVQRYVAQVRAGESPWNTINATRLTDAEIAAQPVPEPMIRKLTHAPVVLFVFVDLAVVASLDRNVGHIGVISGGSIYPFVQNILLAARNEGYGGTPTTFIADKERGTASTARRTEADGLRRNDSVREAGEAADEAEAQARGRLRHARAVERSATGELRTLTRLR